MRTDRDGRFCERCQLRVTDVAKLDGDGLDTLLSAASESGGRACARFELEGGRPRTLLGLAAGVLVVALSGCGGPMSGSAVPCDPGSDARDYVAFLGEGASADAVGGMIAGRVANDAGEGLADAIVVLQSTALKGGTQERMTNAQGFYRFDNLPAGNYAIQVLAGRANVSKITALPEDAKFRANFRVDPERDTALDVMVGAVSISPTIDNTSPASSYSSHMIEYD